MYKLTALPLKNRIRSILRRHGYDVVRYSHRTGMPSDFSDRHVQIYRTVRPYTMTSPERVYALVQAVDYIVRNQIPGDIVECGVWKGGSMMAIATSLLHNRDATRQLYLYDTFEGMVEPSDVDIDLNGNRALHKYLRTRTAGDKSEWCSAPIGEVRERMRDTGYPCGKVRYVKGRVEETIPRVMPARISLLRLDTDWYESTRHELEHLFPRLSAGGVLIVDDYGHWAGAQRAVDEYFVGSNTRILLNRIDYSGRIAVKT